MLLSTRSLAGYGLDKIFLLAKKALYSGIDLSLDFGLYDTLDREYLASLVERHALQIQSITAPERKITKKQVETILALADELSIPVVNFTPPHRSDKEKDWFSE